MNEARIDELTVMRQLDPDASAIEGVFTASYSLLNQWVLAHESVEEASRARAFIATLAIVGQLWPHWPPGITAEMELLDAILAGWGAAEPDHDTMYALAERTVAQIRQFAADQGFPV